MTRYASDTTVSQDRSLTEIRSTLRRYGADGFMFGEDAGRGMVGFGEDAGRGMVGFRMAGRQVRIVVPLPDGTTVGDTAVPAVALAYQTGRMPPLLPAPERRGGDG